jgi:hypothetical protein
MMVMVKGTTKEGREERWISLFWMDDAAFVIFFDADPIKYETGAARACLVSPFFRFRLERSFCYFEHKY